MRICRYRRERASLERRPRAQASGVTDPLGTSASATTRNTIATSSVNRIDRNRNHSGVIAELSVGTPDDSALEIGPETASARHPASSRRVSPNRTPSS